MSETDYFSHYASINDLSAEGRRRLWRDYDRLFRRFLPADRDARVLDIGCGAGLLLEWLRDSLGVEDIRGVDTDPGQVEFARGLGLDVRWVGDPADWLADEGRFDVIILKDVLEHVPPEEDQRLLAQVADSLSEEGRLILSVPNANSTFGGRFRYIDATHHRSYTELSVEQTLAPASLVVTGVYAQDVWRPRSVAGVIRLLCKLVARSWRRLEAVGEFGREGLQMPLSPNLLVVARRRR